MVLAAFSTAPAALPALAAGDAFEGEKLARTWCAACHVVADDQQRGSEAVPSFAAIAASPGRTEENLQVFLVDPHPKMPDMNLSRREIADLVAYILNQKK
ncbi:cytochrome c [Stappia sp. F7233]|uniref:Cytochrome c n=2 Tax=Stappia albiluteola TaxID=2758565 RepID=A0A839AHZ9_9HYPH|nr:cytochrome c [Stappia albiluteola]